MKKNSDYRFFGSFRFFLALLVVISHSLVLGGDKYVLYLKPWGLGNTAVMIFFVLSGFIIAEATDKFYKGNMKKFIINRCLRIFPPYFMALIISISIHIAIDSSGSLKFLDYDTKPENIFSGLNYISNVLYIFVLYGLGYMDLSPDYPFVRYIWAIRVELHFYLIYALIQYLIFKRKSVKNFNVISVAYIFISILSLIAIFSEVKQLNYFNYAPYFMCGVSMFYVIVKKSRSSWLGMTLSFILSIMHYVKYVGKSDYAFIIGPVIVFILLSVSIIILYKIKLPSKYIKLDQIMGDLSYPIYLNHYVISIATLSLIKTRGTSVLLLNIFIAIVISYIASKLIEPHLLKFRNKLRGRSINA